MAVVSLGELLIDFVALESGVSVGDVHSFQKAPGGAPANVAVAVARLGWPSAFLGQVGDDPFGHFLAQTLTDQAVNVDGLRFSQAARTMLAFVSLAADGDRSFMFYRHPSADMLMEPGDLALDQIDSADIFHFGSITLISEPARSATIAAVDYARQQGKRISYDPNLRLALWPAEASARDGLLSGLDWAHIVKISEEEVVFLTGESDIAPLWRPDMQMIVVTRGADGSTMHLRDGRSFDHPGYVVDAVDTTGAGDSFVGALLTEILRQERDHGSLAQPETILPFANAAGALTTLKRGAIMSMPSREDVLAFMQKQNA